MKSNSTIDPQTVTANAGTELDYYAALDIAQRDGITVEHARNRHHAAQVIASGWTPSAEKLTSERQRVEKQLADIEAKEREQADLAERWNLLLAERDDIAKRVHNVEIELQSIAEEIEGRERFIMETCIGFPQAMHGQIGRYSQLAGVVLGMKAAQAMVAELLPKLREQHSAKLSDIGAFSKTHSVNAGSN